MTDQSRGVAPRETALSIRQEQTLVHGKDNVVLAIANLTKSTLTKSVELRQEIRDEEEKLASILSEHQEYRQISENITAAQKRKKELKIRATTQQAATLMDKIKNLKQDRRELQKKTSDYLIEYNQATQLTMFELDDGREFHIEKVAKLTRIK